MPQIAQQDNLVIVVSTAMAALEERNGNIGELLLESRPNLGYCPARFFWDETINLREPDIKINQGSKRKKNSRTKGSRKRRFKG